MRISLQLAVVSAVMALTGASARADTILSYTFDPGAYFNLDNVSDNSVTGSFDYDVTTQTLTNVKYNRGGDIFNVATLGSPGEVYFGDTNTGDYDVYEFANSLANGGTDVITQGYHPAIVVDAGGSVSTTTIAAAPEPATWVMMLMGIGLLGAVMRAHGRSGPHWAGLRS